jgi:hypothetical protein
LVLFFRKEQDSSFSEEKEAKRLFRLSTPSAPNVCAAAALFACGKFLGGGNGR